MLRKIYLYSVFVTVCLTTPGVTGEIDKNFKAKLLSMPPDSQITALIFIRDKVDLVSLVAQFAVANADRATRHRTVIEALQVKANNTQSPFLTELASQKTAGEFSDYKSYWIDNVIYVRGKVRALLAAENIDGISTSYIIKENIRVKLRTPLVPEPVTMQSSCANGTAQPNLKQINAHKVWEMGLHGEGRLVCIFDSGVNLHDALSSSWRGNQPGVSANEAWFDPFFQSTEPFDTDSLGTSHGTRVTGIAMGIESPDTIGVAWGAQWIAALVIDLTDPDFDPILPSFAEKIISAYEWAIDPDGNPNTVDDVPDVINNSWGHDEDCDATFWAAIDAVEAAGIVNIIAVANTGREGSGSVNSPESRITTELVNFGIGNINTTVTPFKIYVRSGRGPSPCAGSSPLNIKPEIVAPGTFICSSQGVSSYGINTGASLAAPHVSGTVALMRQVNPNLTVSQIKQILIDTAVDFNPSGNDNTYGYGMLDTHAAVLKALDDLPDRTSNSSLATAHNGGRRLVRDGSGNYHLVYQAGNQVFYAKYSSGGSWSSDVRISDGLGEYGYPAIAERNGNVYVTWQQNTGSSHDVWFHISTDGGSSWPSGNRQILAGSVGASEPLPVIASPSSNNVVVAYRQGGNIKSKHSSNNGSSWSIKTINGSVSNSPSVAPGKTPWSAASTVLAYATAEIPSASDIKANYYYNGWSSEKNLTSGLPGNLSRHAHPSIAFSGDLQNRTHIAPWDADDSFRYARVILHKVMTSWNNPSTYYEFYYQTEDRPSITGLAGATAAMVFRRGNVRFFTGDYNGSTWTISFPTLGGTDPSLSVGNQYAKYVYTTGNAAPYSIQLSATELSKGSSAPVKILRAAGMVDEKQGAWTNIVVESFRVKHKDGSISQVPFAPAPADTAELTAAEAWAALSSTQFALPADAESLTVVYSFASDKALGLKQSGSPVEIEFKMTTMSITPKEKSLAKLKLSSNVLVSQTNRQLSVDTKGLSPGETIVFKTALKNQKSASLTVSLGHIYELETSKKKAVPGLAEKSVVLPDRFSLQPNFPNPFNPETSIRYLLPEETFVRLEIYNLLGQKVRVLYQGRQNAGFRQIQWDGKNDFGQPVASSVYIVRLQAGSFVESIKTALVR